MKTPTLADAVDWIAANDNDGDAESARVVATYISVVMAADLFQVSPHTIAKRVVQKRRAAQ